MALSADRVAELVRNQDQALVDSRFSLLPEPTFRGKVRDTYDLGRNRLLIVATDRISTFDCVHPNGIPGKGIVLNQMTLNWLELLKNDVPNHLISANQEDFPEPFRSEPELAHRSMMVRELHMLPVECIVRGNITGSAWVEYKKSGTVLGQNFRNRLMESQEFDTPLFTPSTKAESGHDQNITYEQMADLLTAKFGLITGKGLARKLKTRSLIAYVKASEYARSKGIIIADTKFEFGLDGNGNLVLADEVLTPDSSRFWDKETYQLGKSQDSFDKQSVRDWVVSTGWDKNPPAPVIPQEVTQRTQAKYLEAYRRLFP